MFFLRRWANTYLTRNTSLRTTDTARASQLLLRQLTSMNDWIVCSEKALNSLKIAVTCVANRPLARRPHRFARSLFRRFAANPEPWQACEATSRAWCIAIYLYFGNGPPLFGTLSMRSPLTSLARSPQITSGLGAHSSLGSFARSLVADHIWAWAGGFICHLSFFSSIEILDLNRFLLDLWI